MERDFLGLSKRQAKAKEHVQEHHNDNCLHQQQGGQFGNLVTSNLMSAVDFQKTYKPTASFVRGNQFVGAFWDANANANAKQRLLKGVPLTARNSPYPTMAPLSSSPLTIMYGGTVTAFNDISPEKAQAIISLAENSKGVDVTRGESNCSKISSKPVAVAVAVAVFSESSSSDTQSESVNMKIRIKPVATDATAFMDSFRADTFAPANIIPSVPLARKASLVRFMEKRKERFTSTMPYNMTKKMFKDFST